MDFEELAAARAEIKRFVRNQQISIAQFWDPDGNNYRITRDAPRRADAEREVDGLTSTYTCLESLIEAGAAAPKGSVEEAVERLKSFAKLSIGAHPVDWKSDNSGWAYCRVRSLGTIARHRPELLAETEVAELLEPVWSEAHDPNGGAYGVRELSRPPLNTRDDPRNLKYVPPSSIGDRVYTPNAYLSYWALFVGDSLPDGRAKDAYTPHRKAIRDWLLASLSEQIAFHESRSPHADPQQLAWSIAGVVRSSEPEDLVKNARKYDIVYQGLLAFFAQQHERGDWDRGKALFNYQQAGTAYCYGYETLAELLAIASDEWSLTEPRTASRVAEPFRKLLRPFADHLVQSFRYARDIALPLNGEPNQFGWASGHQANRHQPESWATASAYRFMQRLRLLIGRWTNEDAQRLLDARQPKPGIDMDQRGATWNLGYGSTGTQLSCFFALPVLGQGVRPSVALPDPDEELIPDGHGRAAILFGPPGTGKTTMVEGVAAALKWPFIEVSPAQFLDRGLDRVSERADQIFRQMMELDRCVVLLDEIDELVKRRTNDAEAWERFFTTTMLPRLARLWEMGKIIFFANTNDIGEIDAAIRRSQRFDAAILVLPPGSDTKSKWLEEESLELSDSVSEAIENLLGRDPVPPPPPGEDRASIENAELAWYALARFDQRRLLVDSIRASTDSVTDPIKLGQALQPIGRALARQDWTNSVNDDDDIAEQAQKIAQALLVLRHSQRRGNLTMFVTTELEVEGAVDTRDSKIKMLTIVDADPEAWAARRGMTLSPSGELTLDT